MGAGRAAPGRTYKEIQARYWGLPVPPHLKHGPNTWAKQAYGCGCRVCLPSGRRWHVTEEKKTLTGAERRRRSRNNLRGKPVPSGTKHGVYTYRVYNCRCDVCSAADSRTRWRRRWAWLTRARGSYEFLPDKIIVHWPPATAGADWTCPECGWSREEAS